MKFFVGIFVALLLGIVALTIFVWSGRYNVAATAPHWDITVRLMEEALDRSIKFHSQGIQAPSLKDSKLIKAGFREYHAMCRLCHGAPGYPQTEIAKGLYPKPPNLGSKDMQQVSDAELYWVVKNGIKMTGMPAFGPTHDEDEVWAIVAFLKRMPSLQPGEYEALARGAGRHKEGKNHHHGVREH
jgi:mono/diheme cytochrome c family protein